MSLRPIEYFYSTHSAYAYLGCFVLQELCRRYACRLVHRPIELSPVVEASGAPPFASRSQAHVDYFFGRELERWAAYRDVPMIDHRPTHHDAPLTRSSGLLIAGLRAGHDVDALSRAILQAHWRDDIDLMDEGALAAAAAGVGLDAGPLLAQAMDDEVQAVLADNTREAIARGVFGSPTYIVDGEMFYGQDRLELLERALVEPFPKPGFCNPAR